MQRLTLLDYKDKKNPKKNGKYVVILFLGFQFFNNTYREFIIKTHYKKRLKTPKRRSTENTMAKRKRTKGQSMIYKILHRKLKIEQHEPH